VDIALFAVDDQVYAVRNDCPHQHFSMLHEGMLHGCELTCPMHGWRFDLRIGGATTGGGQLKRFQVRVLGDEVWVEVPRSDLT
jgi:nitrite reductase (NADH) small subunit